MILNSNDNKKLIIFLQDIRPFEAVGCAGFLELIQHTVQPQTSRYYTMFIYYFFMLFNKTIHMYYSLFMFCFYYKIIGLSFKKICGPQAYPSLAHGYGLGLERAGRARPGPNINGLGWAWA